MSTRPHLAKPVSHRLWLAIVGVTVMLAVLMVWAAKRESNAERDIRLKLAALRAAGEPLDAPGLMKLYPDPPPELDAALVLSNAFVFATEQPVPPATPSAFSPPMPRAKALDEPTLTALRRYVEETSSITNLLPRWPDGLRIADHMERGIYSGPTVSFIKLGRLQQLLTARALYAAEVGDTESAAAMLEQSFHFAHAIPSDSLLVSHMIRMAHISAACKMTERCLNRATFTDAQLARLLTALPPPEKNGFLGTLRVEHCGAIWAFTEVRAGRRLDDLIEGRTKIDPWWKCYWDRLRKPAEYNDRDFLVYLETMSAARSLARQAPSEGRAEFAALWSRYQTNVTCAVSEAVNPNWAKAWDRHYEGAAQVTVTRAALGVERYRRAHGGELPRALELLPAPLGRERDPFSERPLHLMRLTNGYTIYSLGADAVDDGGRERTNSMATFGYDVGVTVER